MSKKKKLFKRSLLPRLLRLTSITDTPGIVINTGYTAESIKL